MSPGRLGRISWVTACCQGTRQPASPAAARALQAAMPPRRRAAEERDELALVLVAALGIDADGHKHPLGLIEGATENAAVVQALIDNLIERGLDPKVCRLFIIDGAKALSKVIRRTFGAHTPIQRCQLHKARNVIERLPKPLHASVRRVLRQAWELDDADKAERLLRNLARRLDQEAPGVAASILEGLDEMLTVNRLGLPVKLRRSLACTNSIENM